MDSCSKNRQRSIQSKLCRIDKNTDQIEDLLDNLLGSTVRQEGYNYIGPGNAGSVAPGFRSYSIANVGSNDALIDGQILPAGLVANYPAGGNSDVLSGITYDSQTSYLVITTVL